MGLVDDFDSLLASQDSSAERPNDADETEQPKKRRGRPKGSKNKSLDSKVSIDSVIVQNLVHLCFSTIVTFAGSRWTPLDTEESSIATNLKVVLEKRLPEGTLENIPEYTLALTVIFYVTRCMSTRQNPRLDSDGNPIQIET